MIPKKIHYCWLSGEEIPEDVQKCMATWKEFMPDYEIILWDKRRFDVNSVAFVKEAVSVKKWAFAADYIRLYALYSEGGIYLDSDVIVKKNFDDFLVYDFFSAVEAYTPDRGDKNRIYVHEDGSVVQKIAGVALQAAVIGGNKENKFLKDCLEWYANKHFILPDGSFFDKIVSPDIYASIAQRYGFRYKNEEQNLSENMKIYPSFVFAPNILGFTKDSYAIHCTLGSWRSESIFRKIAKNNNLIRKLFGKSPKINANSRYDFVQNCPIWK